MTRTKYFGTLVLALLAAVAACEGNGDREALETERQEQPVTPGQGMDEDQMAQMMELQQIQQQLQPVQQQALQDEELASQLESLQLEIEAAMRAENSEAMDRMAELQGELASAQESGNQERMQALMVEAQGLQQEVQALQGRVMERPAIQSSVEEFEAANRARMIAIDPEAEALLDRMDELIVELSN